MLNFRLPKLELPRLGLNFFRAAAVAVAAIILATVLRAAIDYELGEPILYTTFYLAVMVSSLYGGWRWGILSTLCAAFAAWFWSPQLGPTGAHEITDLAEMLLFLITSAVIVWLCHRMRSLRHQAEDAAEERQRLLIAEQAARREAEHLNHAKDDFLAAVSHELRTPLQSILGWTQMLRNYNLDEEETDLATASIERSVRIQTQLVNDLLDLSRIVMGKLRLDVRPVELGDVVRAAVQTVYPTAQAKKVELEVECDCPAPVLGDPDRLQQVVWNLLTNAIKFTPGGGHVRASVSSQGGSALIEVSDTGEGIDPAFLPNVFERFRQADGARPREGLGLGLAIVHELIELHGGTITAHSGGIGQGTQIRATLPTLDAAVLASRTAGPTNNSVAPAVSALTKLTRVTENAQLRRSVCTTRDHASSNS